MKTTAAFFQGTIAGAALTYFRDPVVGRRHRALLRDAAIHGNKVLGRAISVGSRDIVHRAKGIFERIKDLFESDVVDDAVLTERVRTKVGRVCSHPNVEVIVEDGCVLLQGPVVARERRAIFKSARSVKGVHVVVDRMEPYVPLHTMPTQAMKIRQPGILQRHWAPATRVVAGAIGSCMLATGLKSGKVRGAVPAVTGAAILLRAIKNRAALRTCQNEKRGHASWRKLLVSI
jgi:hypothetical protein